MLTPLEESDEPRVAHGTFGIFGGSKKHLVLEQLPIRVFGRGQQTHTQHFVLSSRLVCRRREQVYPVKIDFVFM